MNISKQTVIRTVVFEVSPFMGNPVFDLTEQLDGKVKCLRHQVVKILGLPKHDTSRRTMITVTKENHYESLDIKNWRQEKTNDVINAGKKSIFVFIFFKSIVA